jgi:outer membrane lipoprotein SlyB
MTAGTADRTHAPDKRAGILYPAMLIAAVAVIVFSVLGMATMVGWMPGTRSGGPAVGKAADTADTSGGRAISPRPTAIPSCDDCGTIEAIRADKIDKNMKSTVTYQVTVRMSDGTTRMVQEATLPDLVIGQRVRVSERGVLATR